MKGYWIVAMVFATILLCLPPLFAGSPLQRPALTAVSDSFAVKLSDGSVQTVSTDALVLRAVAASLPTDAPDEAIKATAVAWYSLFCYECANVDDGVITSAPLDADTMAKSPWEDDTATLARFTAACEAVRGECLMYNGAPIMALTHGMNGGITEAYQTIGGEKVPYLTPVESPWDAANPDRLTTITLSVEQAAPILQTLAAVETLPAANTWFSAPVVSEAGTVEEITVCGKPVSGTAVCEAFSLPSAAFTVAVQEQQVIFTVQGKGHFVGMSLYGAAAMAAEGASWQEIVKHYYSGVEI